MRTPLILCVSVLLVSCGSKNQDAVSKKEKNDSAKVFFADSGYSSITITRDTSNGTEVYWQMKKERTYNMVRFRRGSDYTDLLVTEVSTQKLSLQTEGAQGVIELSGRVSENGNFNKELWKKELEANAINFDWDYFEAVYAGCCGAVDGKKICRYSDGEELMNITSDLYEAEIPNTMLSRYIGYWDLNSPLERPAGAKDSLILGILTMVDPVSRSSQRICIRAKNDSIMENMQMAFGGLELVPENKEDKYNPDANLLELWSQDRINDPNKLSGFVITVKFDWDKLTELKFPVKNGKIDLSGIQSDMFDIIELKPVI